MAEMKYTPMQIHVQFAGDPEPVEWTPELAAAFSRAVGDVIRQHLDTMEERILYGRPVSNVTVVDGQIVTRPELPEGGR